MKLSMEVPTKHISQFMPLLDFDFVLAQRILHDEVYRREYQKNPINRLLMMDNGFHELGGSLSIEDLLRAAGECDPSVIICPDKLGDAGFTLASARQMQDEVDATQLAGVVQGEDREKREILVRYYLQNGFSTICFPYREPRLDWFDELNETFGVDLWVPKFHWLGMQSLEECEKLAVTCGGRSEDSFDTAKPIKWGLRGEYLDKRDNLHGGTADYTAYLDTELVTSKQVECTLYNLCLLRKVLA